MGAGRRSEEGGHRAAERRRAHQLQVRAIVNQRDYQAGREIARRERERTVLLDCDGTTAVYRKR